MGSFTTDDTPRSRAAGVPVSVWEIEVVVYQQEGYSGVYATTIFVLEVLWDGGGMIHP
jgi:hypothetical protein